MQIWKRDIFVSAIKLLMVQENKTAEEVITRYIKLTDAERMEILAEVNKQ